LREVFRKIVFIFKSHGKGNLLNRHIGLQKKSLPLGQSLIE